MKIISRNVNWIRAIAKKWFKDFIKNQNPDILCIQETKAFEDQFLKEVWELEWYKYIWHAWERAWYAWTAIFAKDNLIKNGDKFWKNKFSILEEEIWHFHDDWRITEAKFENFTLINWYFPNWWTRSDWTEMLSYKLEFYDKLINYCNELVTKWENVIITWDYNICHTEIDIARPKQNKNSIWFLPIERAKIWEFLDNWYIDVFRYFNPELLDKYTWWSYRWWARQNNVGWRLDYFFVSKNIIWKVKNVDHLDQILGSDHCPIMIEIDL